MKNKMIPNPEPHTNPRDAHSYSAGTAFLEQLEEKNKFLEEQMQRRIQYAEHSSPAPSPSCSPSVTDEQDHLGELQRTAMHACMLQHFMMMGGNGSC